MPRVVPSSSSCQLVAKWRNVCFGSFPFFFWSEIHFFPSTSSISSHYRLSKKIIQNQLHTKKAFFVTRRHDSFHSSRDHEQRWKHQRVLVLRGWIVCRNAGASVVFSCLNHNENNNSFVLVLVLSLFVIIVFLITTILLLLLLFLRTFWFSCGSICVLLRQCDQRFGR